MIAGGEGLVGGRAVPKRVACFLADDVAAVFFELSVQFVVLHFLRFLFILQRYCFSIE